MIGRRGRSDLTVSLFPFLSILACVIGTLTLLLAGLTVGALATDVPTQKGVEFARALRDELREALAAAGELLEKVTELEIQNAKLKNLKEGSGEEEELAEKFLENIREATERLRRVQMDSQAIADDTERVKKEAIEKSRPQKKFVLQTSGSGSNWKPRFVECDSHGIVLDPDGVPNARQRIRKSNVDDSSKLKSLYRQVRNSPHWRVVFVIRPGGTDAYYEAYFLLRKTITDDSTRMNNFGFMAVPSEDEIDYSPFAV